MSDGDFEGWNRGRKAINRSILKRKGWKEVFHFKNTAYWLDPISGETLDDNRAFQRCAERERGTKA